MMHETLVNNSSDEFGQGKTVTVIIRNAETKSHVSNEFESIPATI